MTTAVRARIALAAILVATGVSLVDAALSSEPPPTEYQVKAAYLYNFGRFVEWPGHRAGQGEPFALCVLGHDPFGDTLDHVIQNATIAGQQVVARRIAKAEDAANCRIAFISESEEKQLAKVVSVLDKSPVLTVSDIRDFTRRGGMIQFVIDDNRVRFDVNLKPADEAGLVISSDLLRVAVNVLRRPRQGD